MSENNLFQFAQVITEMPLQTTSQQPQHTEASSYRARYIPIRKNACIICSKCFTCSKFYGVDCHCPEVQPRRGKNLPEGGLDSRAKKLHRDDPDYEFSIHWINENANAMYKDQNSDTVIGLRDLSEVSLCKAHSSTLYRAKKRHERMMVTPPSPEEDDSPVHYSGGLAAKVREISNQYNQFHVQDVQPDFTRMSHSHSAKRKRSSKSVMRKSTSKSTDIRSTSRPHPSMSTPVFNSRMFIPENNNTIPSDVMQQQSFPSQLPPLHTRNTECVNYNIMVETVSLKPMNSNHSDSDYYFRNLAITDTFTFRDLLTEIDMTGSPPPGKRIVISDQHKFYPLDQAIRNVIRRPTSTHVELFLGLTDKPTINWNHYS